MNTEAITIGAYEAKTHFSEILEKAANGIPYIITKRGRAMVKLVPMEDEKAFFGDLATREKAVRTRIQAKTGTIDVRALINEGRNR